jgi:rod shape determining protein RodA
MIFFQVLVNVGMVVGLLPVTGIPLPFISYGGASLVSLAAGLGTLQSANLRRERPEW